MMFTVFTPVFNRAETLHRPWNSLRAQTDRDFEWVVVDDGSTDDSWQVLQQYAAEADFPVRLVRQENRGKHIAWNRAVDVASGELFVPLDSDDECIPETLARFREIWQSIPPQERAGFSGVNVLCSDPETGKVVGNPYPASPMRSNNLELYYRLGIHGEKWGCIRTDVLRQFRFPEVSGGVLPEAYIWHQLARKYQVLCVNEPLRLYYRDQANHLSPPSRNGKIGATEMRAFYAAWHFGTNLDYLSWSPVALFRAGVNVWRFGLHAHKPLRRILESVPGAAGRVAATAFMPFGALAVMIERRMGRA